MLISLNRSYWPCHKGTLEFNFSSDDILPLLSLWTMEEYLSKAEQVCMTSARRRRWQRPEKSKLEHDLGFCCSFTASTQAWPHLSSFVSLISLLNQLLKESGPKPSSKHQSSKNLAFQSQHSNLCSSYPALYLRGNTVSLHSLSCAAFLPLPCCLSPFPGAANKLV